MKIKLSEFQVEMLVSVMRNREKAVKNETDALTMVFKTNGHELPKDGRISIDGDTLTVTVDTESVDATSVSE